MSSKSLKAALNDGLIDFLHCVRVTDLLEEYALPYNEVHQILDAFLSQQETQQGTKYAKRFLVQGEKPNSSTNIFTVVDNAAKLEECLRELKNAEHYLYSVTEGIGAKEQAQALKPMRQCAVLLENVKCRPTCVRKVNINTNGSTENTPTIKTEPKADARKVNMANFSKELTGSSTTKQHVADSIKKSSPESKTSPETKISPLKKKTPDNKKTAAALKSTNKKGINNFFTAAAANTVKKAEPKDTKASVIKPPTPKKMEDFFRKPQGTTVQPKKEPNETPANTSLQLFATEEEEAEPEADEVSSDEEDKLEALKRDIITSDHEEIDEEEPSTSNQIKRRRIEDSDDEEEAPQQKYEKKEEANTAVVAKSETFLDEDGFVITIKPKKSTYISPPKKKPSPPKVDKKTKATPAPATKTKQGNIMNFFNKK